MAMSVVGKFGHSEHSMAMSVVGKFGHSEHSMAMSVNYDCWQVDPSKHGTAMSYGL